MFSFAAFSDELRKIAGVGWDLQGYRGRLGQQPKGDPNSGDATDYNEKRLRLQVRTGHPTNYKYNHYMMANFAPLEPGRKWTRQHEKLLTDEAYSDTPQVVNLTRPQLKSFVEMFDAAGLAAAKDKDPQSAWAGTP